MKPKGEASSPILQVHPHYLMFFVMTPAMRVCGETEAAWVGPRLQWGSGVRISSGAPVLSADSPSHFAAFVWYGRIAIPRTRAASSPWIATPQRHVTKFYVEDHAGPAAACRVRCAGVGIAAASLVVTTILGSRTVKVDPRPDSLSTVMSPPIMRASLREIASPSPVPP